MTSGKHALTRAIPAPYHIRTTEAAKLYRLWLKCALLPRLLRLHSDIGRDETIFKPIELVDARPKLLKFRQPEFERPDY
jgi:hypothetical protein